MAERDQYRPARLRVIGNDNQPKRGLNSDGGGSTFDPMEPRVAALEKAFEKMDSKLDILVRDVSYLKGKVDSMPSTLQLLGFVVAIFVAAGVAKYFGH